MQSWEFSHRKRDSVALTTGSSILIMIAGMLVPILAAAPFYIADRRAHLEQDEKPESER